MKVKNIKVGCDPELFLRKNGEIISAEGMIGGTKEEPKYITDKGHAIQEDNIMVEFNIPASETSVQFLDNINLVKEHLETIAKLQGCELDFSASAVLDDKYLQTEQAKMFGCDPDYNVYLKCVNDPPNAEGNLRSCGGHIHIGYDKPSQEVSEQIIYAMDAIIGLESINLDKDDRRKEMYGKAGAFRFKDYGVEYRTPSNFWIKNDELITWAFEKTMEALDLVNSGVINDIINTFSEEIQNCINNNDKKESLNLLKKIKKLKKVKSL